MDDTTFPDFLRTWLKASGIKQAAVARALGVDPAQVHRFTTGDATPSVKQLVIIAGVFKWNDEQRIRATNLIAREW